MTPSSRSLRKAQCSFLAPENARPMVADANATHFFDQTGKHSAGLRCNTVIGIQLLPGTDPGDG